MQCWGTPSRVACLYKVFVLLIRSSLSTWSATGEREAAVAPVHAVAAVIHHNHHALRLDRSLPSIHFRPDDSPLGLTCSLPHNFLVQHNHINVVVSFPPTSFTSIITCYADIFYLVVLRTATVDKTFFVGVLVPQTLIYG